MDNIVALCRRKGFVFQSSEIYGGINGFWDYGPLGVELKRNLKEAWWHDIVRCPGRGPDGKIIDMVGVDCTIIMNPKVWVASGHAAGFADPMVDCRACKSRFRADHLLDLLKESKWVESLVLAVSENQASNVNFDVAWVNRWAVNKGKKLAPNLYIVKNPVMNLPAYSPDSGQQGLPMNWLLHLVAGSHAAGKPILPCPDCGGELTEPRQFNLMFQTYVGAVQSEDSMAYLRPETAQGIFANFKNVTDTSRVKVPFGIAQTGKAFRNEVTPRNFTFRSREFEQMEIEFFIRPDTAKEWYAYWRDARFNWWKSIGLAGENLQLREHDKDELAHYAKEGAGTSDIEYRFPFTAPGFGELEGVAHRTDFDLRQHAEHSGLGDKLKYFDQELQVKMQGQGVAKEEIAAKSKYFPHVIEPSAGADRGTLALLCEAFTPDPSRPSGVVMKFKPRLAPIKAGIYPLVNKDGMPEVAEKLYMELRGRYAVEYDEKQAIGKRYARMDESGTPFCFTIDGDTLKDQTVTVRHRDTLQQERIGLDKVGAFLAEKIGG
ncbi:MAG: glycine--tRNA ligase [Planctomycetes bacterium]|nr:glycine--tRNA ligase [Planctomycetota bacterium]